MWDIVNSFLVAFVAIVVCHWFYTWQYQKCRGKLPPGSMGFPVIGETFQFFSPFSSNDIPPFIKNRMARYGSLFRTSIVGQKVIVSTDREINYQIFEQEEKSFHIWYLEIFNKIFGEDSMIVYHGNIHKYLKNLILHLVSPQNLQDQLVREMDENPLANIRIHGLLIMMAL